MLFLKTLAVSVIVSSIGFKKFLYFISLGYGFSITAIGLFLLFTAKSSLTMVEIIIGLLYIIYGLRLALFLAIREYKNEHYNKKIQAEVDQGKDVKLQFKIFVWLSVALLYACQTCPLTFRILSNEKDNDKLAYIGIIIICCGLLLEVMADHQKGAAKKINPKRFVDTGLYKIVRCPNYLGELIFWTGNFIGGLKIYNGALQWFLSVFGYILIVYIMFSGARRLEVRQNKYYGDDPVYKKYAKTTPILIPFLPLYSVEKYTWLKG